MFIAPSIIAGGVTCLDQRFCRKIESQYIKYFLNFGATFTAGLSTVLLIEGPEEGLENLKYTFYLEQASNSKEFDGARFNVISTLIQAPLLKYIWDQDDSVNAIDYITAELETEQKMDLATVDS